jgi:hypothetical protein
MSIFNRPSPVRSLRPGLTAALLIVAAGFAFGQPASAQDDASGTLQVQIEANKFGTVDSQTGEVTVSGTIVCSRPANAFVTNVPIQINDGQESTGGWGYNLDCGPTATAFTATFVPCCGPAFTPGKAILTTAAYTFDDEAGVTVIETGSRVVHLKKA